MTDQPCNQTAAPLSLEDVIADYLEAEESGRATDRGTMIERYPQYAAELEEFFDCQEEVNRFARPLKAAAATGPPPEFALELPADTSTLGDFRLIREIGRGGMGIVYEAEQLSLARRVAVKVLPLAAVLDPQQVERFKNEARMAATLKHPHIVSVYWVGSERAVHFYAMELVDGLSLDKVIEQLRDGKSIAGDCPDFRPAKMGLSPSPDSPNDFPASTADTSPIAALSTQREARPAEHFRTVARLGIQAAEALAHAHHLGIVHRDIKPSNLLISHAQGDCPDFRPAKMGLSLSPRDALNLRITDFGLAQLNGDGSLTLTGDLLGTLRYMSPEQASGRPAAIDHRTDIYSLGITLYELVTLQPAFGETDRARLLHDILEREPPAPRTINGTAPKDLETIILKATAKEPLNRYDSAHELAEDLNRFLDQKPIRARRSTKTERFWRWCRRNPVVATLCATVFLLVLLSELTFLF